SKDGTPFSFDSTGSRWNCNLADYALEKTGKASATTTTTPQRPNRFGGNFRAQGRTESRRAAESPDGKWSTFVRDGNLYLKEKSSGEEFQLSKDAAKDEGYDQGVYWSPDATHFTALRTKKAQEHLVYTIESSPKDQFQ